MYDIASGLRIQDKQSISIARFWRDDGKWNMTSQGLPKISIAIASDSLQQRSNLRKLMEQSGLNVVLSEPLTRLFLRKLDKSDAEVLLLDLHDDQPHDEDLLHELLDQVKIPIIFNDVTALLVNEPARNPKWHLSLMRKIAESTGIEVFHVQEQAPSYMADRPKTEVKSGAKSYAKQVWVLGASLGGPEALKRFLRALPVDIPAAFIVAQHLGANFVNLLAEQLDRACGLRVMAPSEGHILRHQDVVVCPVSEHMIINSMGCLELEALDGAPRYSPSIDMVIGDVAKRYGKHAGAIIFSGMGDDGSQGCSAMLQAGGQVWIQSQPSCVVSSMPDNVKQNCQPQFTGSPEVLATQLVKFLNRIEEH